MIKKDILIAAICGVSVSWIMIDLFGAIGWIFIIIFPILSIVGLWLCEVLGKKFPFIHQAGKFGLAGAFADVVDIKIFQLFFLFLPFSAACKIISFLVGTLVKYFSDKFWTFEKYEKHDMHKEMAKFFVVAIIGSAINVISFKFFETMQTGLPEHIWQELCIIWAALVTAIWNFLGYKFVVFKK